MRYFLLVLSAVVLVCFAAHVAAAEEESSSPSAPSVRPRERPVAERPAGSRASRPAATVSPKVGEPAPRFRLPVLKEAVDEEGNVRHRITDEHVGLADFRDKKIVCVFLSSYT